VNRRHFLFTAHARRKLCTVAAAAEQRAAAALLELSTLTEAHAAAVRACALLELETEALHTQLRKRNGTPACLSPTVCSGRITRGSDGLERACILLAAPAPARVPVRGMLPGYMVCCCRLA
jgi:hypothetical protein